MVRWQGSEERAATTGVWAFWEDVRYGDGDVY